MKFILIASSCLAASAFGVSHNNALQRKNPAAVVPPSSPLRTEAATTTTKSPLFRKGELTRGGAVPGWAAYNEALDKKPLVTKAMTSLVGWALGDMLAQLFISGGPFDFKRFATLSAFGFLYHGPSGHFFYDWLDNFIPGTDAIKVASKVTFDQIFWCPIFMSVFFTYLGLVNGDSFSVIGNKIKSDLFTAVQGSWKVWPVVHAVSFKYISTKHRLLFLNAIQIAFNMFLSLIGTKK